MFTTARTVSSPGNKCLAPAILVSVCLAGALTISSQCKPELPSHLMTAKVLGKAGQVSGILEELAVRRDIFLTEKSTVDLFAALYFHSTEVQFRNIPKYDVGTAESVLDLVILFYDAYKHNRALFDRGGDRYVEKHWQKYYQRAEKLKRKKKASASDLVELMLDGIDAHLTDLPRALRTTFLRMPITVEQLRGQYFEMEGSFSQVSNAMNADLVHVNGGPAGILSADAMFGVGTKYVNLLRKRAWEEAVSGQKLKASGPQPVLVRTDVSRKYFSLFAAQCPPVQSHLIN
jgi:hypothetical protein